MKACRGCGEPTGRAPQAKWCRPCKRKANYAARDRYMRSSVGRASRRRYAATPRAKLLNGIWKQAHPERVAASEARRVRHRRGAIGFILPCATLGCEGAFARTRHNGAQRFCPECARLSRAYSNRLANLRYHRRRLARAA